MLDTVVFEQPQHAVHIGSPSHIHRIFSQFIHGGEVPCQSMSARAIEPVSPGLEKGLTRFCPRAEDNLTALHITTAPREKHTQKQKGRNQKIYYGESPCLTHPSSPWI